MDYRERYRAWLNYPGLDEATRAELTGLSDEKEIEDRFYRELEFGTAGLRGVLGAGINRMNSYVVKRATQGFANYILSLGEDAQKRGVAIAYDSRRMSDVFAMEAALVLCANGIRTYLYDGIRAVPQLSFAVLKLHCIAGIVITASHNPPQYNGYKVYGETGGQLPPEPSAEVTKHIEAVGMFEVKSTTRQEAEQSGLLQWIGAELDEAYDACVQATSIHPEILAASELKVVYTPLHGAGAKPVKRVLQKLGFRNLITVAEQEIPDGNFPTIRVPNPEERDAYDMAIALAKKNESNLILATDPDSDRLGVAALDQNGEYRLLSGNQIACILLEYLLSQKKAAGSLPKHGFAVESIVSTPLAGEIARNYGVQMDEVLTGFRFISDKIYESLQKEERTFLFGFEESFGFLAGTYARDKDGIGAAVLLCEAASYYALQNKTLLDALEDIYRRYGFYTEKVISYALSGKEGIQKIQNAMSELRQSPPAAWGPAAICAVRDYSKDMRVDSKGEKTSLGLPPSNVLYYELQNGGFVAVRPSGTEPKLKAYISVCAENREQAQEKADGVILALRDQLDRILGIK